MCKVSFNCYVQGHIEGLKFQLMSVQTMSYELYEPFGTRLGIVMHNCEMEC